MNPKPSLLFVGSIAILAGTVVAQYEEYSSIQFTSPNKGFFAADSGYYYMTENAGTTWMRKRATGKGDISAINFPTPQVGYMVGSEFVLKTTDGGVTWTEPSTVHLWLTEVHFHSPDTGIAVGVAGNMSTSDGGQTWGTFVHSTATGPMTYHDVWITPDGVGYLVGLDGGIQMDKNAGAGWESVTSPTTEDLNAVHFPTASAGYIVGNKGTILKTSDGGGSWSAQTSRTEEDLTDVFFVDANNGWAVGGRLFTSVILHTSNGGATWTSQANPGAAGLRSVFFTDANTGYAVGINQTLLKTTNGGASWGKLATGILRGMRSRETLAWNGVEISYRLSAPAHVRARLLDSRGRLVSQLRDAAQTPGGYLLPLPAHGQARGNYLLDFQAGDDRQVLQLNP